MTGGNAALISTISPISDAAYTLNGCIIAAVSCTISTAPPFVQQSNTDLLFAVFPNLILPPNSGVDGLDPAGQVNIRLPFLNGLLSFVFSQDLDDPDLTLPNISDRDY